jgi:hypothetical protein
MAGNARFHDKLHRKNHHTLPTTGYVDSASDPIASHEEPFQGDFIINGSISANSGIYLESAIVENDVFCENIHVNDTAYVNFVSGAFTETIISDGALTGYGDQTLTLDFRKGIYAKTPSFNISNSITANQAIFNSAIINNDLLIIGSISALGDVSVIETNIMATSSFEIVNHGVNPALVVNQTLNNSIALYKSNGNTVFTIASSLATFVNDLSVGGIIDSTNIKTITNNLNRLQNTSGTWDSVYVNVTGNSANWDSSYLTVYNISSNWVNNYTTMTSYSSLWESSRSVLSSLSGVWEDVHMFFSFYSAGWNTTRTEFLVSSVKWNDVYDQVKLSSSNWDNNFNITNSYSSVWIDTTFILNSLSAGWLNTQTNVSSYSSNWDNSYNTVYSNSANWTSGYTIANSYSSIWQDTTATLSSLSAGWMNTQTSVSTYSADWTSGYTIANSYSSIWQDTTATLSSLSAGWVNSYNTVHYTSASWISGSSTQDYTANNLTANEASINFLRLRGTLFFPTSTTTRTTSAQLGLYDPLYFFINPNGTTSVDLFLPLVNSLENGRKFYIKNTYGGGGSSDVHIHDYNKNLLRVITKGLTTEIIWDGTTWQVL